MIVLHFFDFVNAISIMSSISIILINIDVLDDHLVDYLQCMYSSVNISILPWNSVRGISVGV